MESPTQGLAFQGHPPTPSECNWSCALVKSGGVLRPLGGLKKSLPLLIKQNQKCCFKSSEGLLRPRELLQGAGASKGHRAAPKEGCLRSCGPNGPPLSYTSAALDHYVFATKWHSLPPSQLKSHLDSFGLPCTVLMESLRTQPSEFCQGAVAFSPDRSRSVSISCRPLRGSWLPDRGRSCTSIPPLGITHRNRSHVTIKSRSQNNRQA